MSSKEVVSLLTKCLHQVVEELLAAGAKLDPLVFDSYLLPLHMAINKVAVVKIHPGSACFLIIFA